jgi:hypothetical protein
MLYKDANLFNFNVNFNILFNFIGNFTRTSMKDSIITDARLDSCDFIESDIRNIEYSIYPDFLGHSS